MNFSIYTYDFKGIGVGINDRRLLLDRDFVLLRSTREAGSNDIRNPYAQSKGRVNRHFGGFLEHHDRGWSDRRLGRRHLHTHSDFNNFVASSSSH